MSLSTIRALIAEEQEKCDFIGRVRGTPRTYGDRKTEDIWRTCIAEADWRVSTDLPTPVEESAFLTFRFLINPSSPLYGRHEAGNGRDLDTMVIGALAGLISSPSRPTANRLARASAVWGFAAVKELVNDDYASGAEITISWKPIPTRQEFSVLSAHRN
jgi:hypothetical protein